MVPCRLIFITNERKKSFTKSDLADLFFENQDRFLRWGIITKMESEILIGMFIDLHGLGTFSIKQLKSRNAYSKSKKKMVKIPSRKTVQGHRGLGVERGSGDI